MVNTVLAHSASDTFYTGGVRQFKSFLCLFIYLFIYLIDALFWQLWQNIAPVSSRKFLDIQITIECRYTLKRVCGRIITYRQYNLLTWYLTKKKKSKNDSCLKLVLSFSTYLFTKKYDTLPIKNIFLLVPFPDNGYIRNITKGLTRHNTNSFLF